MAKRRGLQNTEHFIRSIRCFYSNTRSDCTQSDTNLFTPTCR